MAIGFKPVQLLGSGVAVEGFGMSLLHVFFLLWRWNQDEKRIPNTVLVPVMLGKPARPQHPTAGFT